MLIPMAILAFLSLTAGFIELPESMGHVHLFSRLLNTVLPSVVMKRAGSEVLFQCLSAIISILGIYLAYIFFLKKTTFSKSFEKSKLGRYFYKGLGFDQAYNLLLVRPVVWLADIDKNDIIDLFNGWISRLTVFLSAKLSLTQNGKLRWYLFAFAFGIVLILTLFMNL